MSDICAEKHKLVDSQLTHHEKWLKEHEEKLDALVKSDATNTADIKNLCRQLGSQTKAIWGLVSAILMVLVGFFVWYVQKK